MNFIAVRLPVNPQVEWGVSLTMPRRDLLIVVFATALAVGLRFYGLGRQPLWLDEATTASFASRPLWDCIFAEVQHPPLFNALVHFVIAMFGNSDFAVRAPSAMFGVLTVPLAWLLARRLFPEIHGTAAAAALLTAGSPFLVYLSQEARSYSLFVFLSILATLAFLRWSGGMNEGPRGGQTKWLSAYACLCAVILYTHYFGVLVLLVHELFYWRHSRVRARAWLVARATVAAAFAPWAVWALTHLVLERREWLGSPWLRIPYAFFRYLEGYGIAAPNLMRLEHPFIQTLREEGLAILLTLAPLVWLLIRGVGVVLRETKRRDLFTAFLLPFVPLLLVSPWLRLIHERYLSFQVPLVLLLVAVGWATLSRKAKLAAAIASAAGLSFALAAYYASPGRAFGYTLQFGKEDWRGAAEFVAGSAPEVVIFAPDYLRIPFERYWQAPAPTILLLGSAEGSGRLPPLGSARRVAVVISHGGSAEGIRLRGELAAQGTLVAEKHFVQQTGIRVFLYDLGGLP